MIGQKWEGKSLTLATDDSDNEVTQVLSELGEEGWELISAIPIATPHSKIPAIRYTFKRPKEHEPLTGQALIDEASLRG